MKAARIYIVFSATALALAAPVSGVADTPNDKLDQAARREILEKLAAGLDSTYAIPETAHKLAALVRAKRKSRAYRDISSGFLLASQLTEDLFAVAHDKHLRVSFSFGPAPRENLSGPSPEDLERIRRENGAISRAEILDGNIGYLRVNGLPFVEGARPAITTAFAFVHNTDALILDLRGNGGGDANTASLYESYFGEGAPYLLGSFVYREGNRVQEFWSTDLGELSYGANKPVFLLTSAVTFSGGEAIAYGLQARKRALIVGELTAGAPIPSSKRVPLGHQLVATVPTARGVHPITKTSWEAVGVKPDVPVEESAALYKAHALALAQLREAAPDEWARRDLDAVAMKVQTIAEAASGSAVKLQNADLLGAYTVELGSGTTVVITEKDGTLSRHIDGIADRTLTPLGGNRYGLEGLPQGFVISFRAQPGKTELLMEQPNGVSVIRVKR